MLVLADRVYRRREAVSGVEEWLGRALAEAGGGGVRVGVSAEGWLTVEAEDERLATSILRLYARFPLTLPRRRWPKTVKLLQTRGKELIYAYPTPEGGAVKERARAAEWAAALGSPPEEAEGFLEAAGVVEGGAASVSAGLPSLLQLKLVKEMFRRGLDSLLLIDLAPQELLNLLRDPMIGRLVARHDPLTTLTHLLYLRLGVGLERGLRRVEKAAQGALVKALSWRALARALKP